MSTATQTRLRWFRRLFKGFVVACWLVFFALLPHESVSPEYFGRYSSEYTIFLSLILLGVIVLTALAFFRIRRLAFIDTMNVGGKLALLLGSLGITLLAVEGFVRGVDFLGVSMYEEVTRYVLDLEADDELVYRHRSNFDAVYQGVPFRTNEIGLRDDPVPSPAADDLRILVLGDSVTVGWGVLADDRFSERLETKLGDRLQRPVQVINSGVSGYNTEQELNFLRRHIESLRPQLVILVYVENDIEPIADDLLEMQRRWKNPPDANAGLLRWSWFYRLLYYLIPDLVTTSQRPAQAVAAAEDGWRTSMEALAQMQDIAASHDTEFVTYLFRMLPDDLTNALEADIARVADTNGFRFVDTLDWFEPSQFRSLTNSFIDTHPNAEGNRIIAEGILRDLEQSGFLRGVD